MFTLTKVKPVMKAPALKHGDRVGLLAPSSRPLTPAVVARCEGVVAQMGFQPVVGKNVLNVHGFMAGTDDERLSDFHTMLSDDGIAAVFFITGGYGALHLLSRIDYDSISRHPKVFAGCDDATSLLTAINVKTGLVTLHAPNIEQIKSRHTFELFKRAVMSCDPLAELQAQAHNPEQEVYGSDFYCAVEGTPEGRLVGGNLTSIASLLGTKYEPVFNDSIIFLEDVNEQNGVLDRWFTSLYLAGHLQSANGVAFGAFENCHARGALNMLSTMDTFSDRLKYLRKSSCFGLPFGQMRDTAVVPIGLQARLHCQSGRLEFLEPALV
jgi:muramoyltetrapeptide carboxypeptidase